MKLLGNIIWIIFGGLVAAVGWFIVGLICMITIIGIPLGRQFFKLAELMITPFGSDVKLNFDAHPIINIIWAIFIGWGMALGYAMLGVVACITIVGIPFGLQWFKLTKLALIPFGAEVI
ncbi:YccF domain-containing protein [Haploplasma axanthum]|uniref:Inner membrane protein yccF n=1 Tax=Haploplasma axanthum TaxID=29552 RepID=A0A449BBJ9_HAPAX|nr:YccF domain-containing protein [Haploplasma axanthum]VEU79803.1 Inner membrane protein yccF [Haploplasma axanthum]